MTAQEKDRIESAIRHIESSLDVDPWAVEIAVEAMEKQIPMKILIRREHSGYEYTSYCPNCKRMDVGGWSYCPDCGQSLVIEAEGE